VEQHSQETLTSTNGNSLGEDAIFQTALKSEREKLEELLAAD